MKKVAVILALLLLFAGCGKAPSHRVEKRRMGEGEEEIKSGVSVKFLDIPEEIYAGKRKYIRIVVESMGDVEDVELSVYFPFESTCNGRKSLGSMGKGERKEISCYIEPEKNGTFEASWKVVYRIPEDGAAVNVTIYDEKEVKSEGGMEKKSFRNVEGYFSVFPSAAVEGTKFRFEAKISDERLAESSGCWCSIERAVVEVPQGFEIEGLEGWRKKECSSGICYVKENLKGLDQEFYGGMRVTKTSSFEIKVKLFNVWMEENGKEEIVVR